MKTLLTCLLLMVPIFKPFKGFAQGTIQFQNLNFESADVPANTVPTIPGELQPTYVSEAQALPAWTADLGSQQLSQVGYNTPTIGGSTVWLIGPNWSSSDWGVYGYGIIDGNYSVVLYGGEGDLGLPESTSIEQNGTIPSTDQSMIFEAAGFNFSVSFEGNALTPTLLSTGVSADGLPYGTYGVNISAWAGQTGELEFTANSGATESDLVLDDISFSTGAVPEPRPLVLTGIGGLLFGLVRRFAMKRQ